MPAPTDEAVVLDGSPLQELIEDVQSQRSELNKPHITSCSAAARLGDKASELANHLDTYYEQHGRQGLSEIVNWAQDQPTDVVGCIVASLAKSVGWYHADDPSIDHEGIRRKLDLLVELVERVQYRTSPQDRIRTYGGSEIDFHRFFNLDAYLARQLTKIPVDRGWNQLKDDIRVKLKPLPVCVWALCMYAARYEDDAPLVSFLRSVPLDLDGLMDRFYNQTGRTLRTQLRLHVPDDERKFASSSIRRVLRRFTERFDLFVERLKEDHRAKSPGLIYDL